MYTYVKYDVPGNFFELEEKLTEDLYSNIGTTWEDFINNKYVLLTDEMVQFHIDNPEADVYEVLNRKLNEKKEEEVTE